MFQLLGFFGLPGHIELMIIGMIVLLLFGNRLPSVMASLGEGIRVFRRSVRDDELSSTE